MATSKKKMAGKATSKRVKKAAPRKKTAAANKTSKKATPEKRSAAKKKSAPVKKAVAKKSAVAKRAPKKAAGKKPVAKKNVSRKNTTARKKTVSDKSAPAKKTIKKKVAAKRSVKSGSTAVKIPMAPQVEEQEIPEEAGNGQENKTLPAVDLHAQAKAMQKNDPRQHLHYSPKPKNPIRPSGKKPLWN